VQRGRDKAYHVHEFDPSSGRAFGNRRFRRIGARQLTSPIDCGSGIHMTTLHFIIGAGEDDLRGGSDNVQLYARLAGRSDWLLVPLHGGLNRSAHWANGSVHPVDVTIGGGACPLPPAYITGLRLQTTFGGGMGDDNWNLRSVHVDWIGADATGAAVSGVMADVPAPARGGYLHRFTGDNTPYDIAVTPR
jgi:hypothetical protein